MMTIRHNNITIRIATLVVAVLMQCGMASTAWGNITITYHVISLPYDNPLTAGTVETYRVEAVRCTSTTTESSLTVELPAAFKSPLAKNYKYWDASHVSAKVAGVKIHSPNNCTYTNYGGITFSGDGNYTEGTTTVTANCDIYVTYEYDDMNTILDLNGGKEYNFTLGGYMMAYNFTRNDRPAAVTASSISGNYLVSSESNGGYYYLWKFTGGDPYNIVVASTYAGSDANKHNSVLFSRFGYNMWLTAPSKKLSNGDMQTGLYTSFALLRRNGGYAFMAANMAESSSVAPNSSGQYQFLTASDTEKNPQAQYKNDNQVDALAFYEVKDYTYKINSPLTSTELTATAKWSSYMSSEDVLSHVPDALKRKYATVTGAYKESAFTNTLSTFADANANSNVIWLSYTSSMPFEALSSGGSYADARWYTIRMNNENQYLVRLDGSNFISGGGSNSSLHQGENSAEAQVAFIGDPYELRIISRKASEEYSANRYIGCVSGAASSTQLSVQTGSSDISAWEMVFETGNEGTMLLRQCGTYADPKYIGWSYGASGNPPVYSTTASRIKVVALEQKTYTYHIYNSSNDIAVKASVQQDVGIPLKLANIPEIIRSPLLAGATLKFYYSTEDALYNSGAGQNEQTNAPYNVTESTNKDIYVKYSGITSKTGDYNVRLNGEYIYYDGGTIKSQATINDTEAAENRFRWTLAASDPYAMIICNEAAGKYVKVASWTDAAALEWDDESSASKFIIKSSNYTGVYEVMAATGDGVDASTTYYNIGRADANTVKVYSNATYQHGYNQLRFLLTATTSAVNVTYHLIDKDNKDLLQVVARQTSTVAPHFPTDYWSPLVSSYHYYVVGDFTHNVVEDTYTLNGSPSELATIGANTDIYVTYDVSSIVNLTKGQMYLLQYAMGEQFRQEDGGDGLLDAPSSFAGSEEEKIARYKAVYPYCNGDCNFFVYGQEQYDIQQQGAASTRTRWAWYLESDNNDPYHVRICSRQTEVYNNDERHAYFRTYAETYGGTKHVVTSLTWPGISGIAGTEYMVLGSVGQYRLLTTETIPIDLNNDGDTNDSGENERHTVNSFEQYWKTYDTVRRKVLNQPASTYPVNIDDPTTVPDEPYKVEDDTYTSNRTYLTGKMGWHCYEKWAYAKRWNGYNADGKTSKGWEQIEHWFQTVGMGEGYFDLVPITIDPALILLDQHGWEIMRKPIPSTEDDPDRETKFEAIRPYDSPMVKAYYFWTKSSKRSGFHQYYNLSQQVSLNGEVYTSTSLTDLAPYSATNMKDSKGNVLDQYVTYVAKDEYIQSYTSSYTYDEEHPDNVTAVTGTGAPFLIRQGSKFASTSDGSTITKNDVPATGGMSQYIIDNISTLTTDGSKNAELWYVMPNIRIDYEMGYSGYAHSWVNDYDLKSKQQTAGFNSYGFDPYNIQLSSVAYDNKYIVSNATGAYLENGIIEGTYSGEATVSLGTQSTTTTGTWHDSRILYLTNATFMAVQDENGNMQLMPRFDHNLRLRNFSTLVTPEEEADDATKLAETYTQLYRPFIYNYLIVDNSGHESLRYRSGGDLTPQTPDWFKSPLAKDYKYFKTLPDEDNDGIYELDDIDDEITESLAGAGLTTAGSSGNNVYVRYSYDESADTRHILQGKWLTMTLNAKDAVYSSGDIKEGSSKPDPVDSDDKEWQWKFTATQQSDPDPYAVGLYSRANSGKTATTVNSHSRFALLNYYNSGNDPTKYTLAVAGSKSYTYDFLNGNAMTTSNAATTSTESGFSGTSCSYDGTKAQVVLTDDVQHTFEYKVYTNDNVFAVSSTQDNDEIVSNDYEPVIPATIKSPLLNYDQFRYYEQDLSVTTDTVGKALSKLYGLYDDIVFVRYTAYDPDESTYKVPNSKTTSDGHVARASDSNDASLDLSNELLYNIIWYNDNMMTSTDGDVLSYETGASLQSDNKHEWKFEGNDPYAIKLKNKYHDRHIYNSSESTCTLSADNASTFMLLPKDGYDYGVLQMTGTAKMLSNYGNELTTSDPTKFIIFALATHKVIYHLVIANIGSTVNIPYSEKDENGDWVSGYSPSGNKTKTINGTSKRDLTSTTTVTGDTYQLGSTINGVNYCFDDGHISLGDMLKVPSVFRRPNCKYFFYVEGIYSDDNCSSADGSLNTKYKGLRVDHMGSDESLLNKTILINIVYEFDDGLSTNTGSQFITNANGTEWYTFETNDATPWLAHFPYDGGLDVNAMAGRDPHYTNDFLWSPVGDPYGFWMYNRYVYKNGGNTTFIMTTKNEATPANNVNISLENSTGASHPEYAIFELLAGTSDGCFKVQTLTAQGGTPYYINNNSGAVTLQSTSATEWSFGLSEAQLKPYYDRAGYVGGLTTAGKTAYEAAANLMEKQAVVYTASNIVDYSSGYYRLSSMPNAGGLTTPRYMSGYTHETEKTAISGGIPLHFYERKGVTSSFGDLTSGFTVTTATRGDIPIVEPLYDPASIFYFDGNRRMKTQGLEVLQNKMTSTVDGGTQFTIEDIGGAVVVINGGEGTPSNKQYLCYNVPGSVYDIQFNSKNSAGSSYSIVDRTKWCMEPANTQKLRVTTHSGGDGYYYATFYAPFDVLLSDASKDKAYVCEAWDDAIIHPIPVGNSNTGTYAGNDCFIPASTPAIIRTTATTGYVTLSLPTTTPSTPLSCVFSGQYLEQKLAAGNDVFTFGAPLGGTLSKAADDYATTGNITAVLPSSGSTDVGFYLNANPNKEQGLSKAEWTRNNWYVLANKIYYRAPAGGGGAPARRLTRGAEFIPVVFDDDSGDQPDDDDTSASATCHDNRIYDLQGRCVAGAQAVADGTWHQHLPPGIYILNGRKFLKR